MMTTRTAIQPLIALLALLLTGCTTPNFTVRPDAAAGVNMAAQHKATILVEQLDINIARAPWYGDEDEEAVIERHLLDHLRANTGNAVYVTPELAGVGMVEPVYPLRCSCA